MNKNRVNKVRCRLPLYNFYVIWDYLFKGENMLEDIYKTLSHHILWPYGEIAFKRLLEKQTPEVIDFFNAHPEQAKQLLKICVSSSYLVNLLVKEPDLVNWLFLKEAILQKKTKEDFLKELRCFISQEDFPKSLRDFKAREYLRLWARDVNRLCPLEENLAELSDLAEACLQACYEHALIILPFKIPPSTKFFILGLGKLGARELNFYSDIDLIYVYDVPFQTSLEVHRFFIKLAETITKLLQDLSYGEEVFKVDLNLRPGGKESEIVQSTTAIEIFYETFGRASERLALLRARPVAGDIKRGEAFLNSLTPFIYRRYLDYSGIEEIRLLKKALDLKSSSQERFNIKLGKGGIRELEFFVHALQLIYAGKIPNLRQYNTFKTISVLKEQGIVSPEDAQRLARAYRYLRRLEHHCQMLTHSQTHTLPLDKNSLLKIVRLMGYVHKDEGEALNMFYFQLGKMTSFVHHLFKTLLHTEETETKEFSLKGLFTDPKLKEEGITYLEKLGFKRPKVAYECISNLKGIFKTPYISKRAHNLFISILPEMLIEISQTINPDLGLIHLEEFISRIGPRAGLYALLKENPHLRKLLLQIFGASKFLSTLFIKHFQLFDNLIEASESIPVKTESKLKEALNVAIRDKTDLEEKIEALRRFKNEEVLRIGFHDLAGRLSYLRVSQQLSLVAELCLKQALFWAKEEVNRTFSSLNLPFIIVVLGKLGSQEMAYESDLDLLFIYDYPQDAELSLKQNAHVYFVKVAQRLISILTLPHTVGPGYKVDTRLRPSGRFGPLVVSLESFKSYYQNQAQPWEFQTLLKARAIIENDLSEKWEILREDLVYGKEVDWKEEIRNMRERILKERAGEENDKFNLKVGKGGLIEIEFLTQYLQLTYGREYSMIRHRHTLEALKAIRSGGLLKEKEANVLIEGYNFLKALEHRLNLLYGRPSDTLLSSNDLRELWQHWGLGKPPFKISVTEVVSYTQGLRQKVRDVWEKIMD